MTRLALMLTAAFVLSACQVRGTGERFMSDAEVEAKDDGTCRQFGAAPGTGAYTDCRLRLRSDRSAEDRSRRLRAAL